MTDARTQNGIMDSMLQDLVTLGIRPGDCLIVHSSFKSLGLRNNSPEDVLLTLLKAIEPNGTLAMPSFTYSYSGIWNVKPFNVESTPGLRNGILSETLRQFHDSKRSGHPTHSIVAFGERAERITANKAHSSALAGGSSIEELVYLGAKILLIGVGNNRNSTIHYAEDAAGLPYNRIPFREFWGSTAIIEGAYGLEEIDLVGGYPGCSAAFGNADAYLEKAGVLKKATLCNADCMYMDAKEMIACIIQKLKQQPDFLLCNDFICEPCTLRRRELRKHGLI